MILRAVALAIALFANAACASASPSGDDGDPMIRNPFPEFTGRGPAQPPLPPPTVITPEDPRWNQGSTYKFTSTGQVSIARRNFDKPRSMIGYAFWDPYKNNPGASAAVSTLLSDGVTPFQVLGRLLVGNQGTTIAYNFDIPWGQPMAIPVGAESLELQAKIIACPVFSTAAGGSLNFLQFNDPDALAIPPGATLPNASIADPQGFVDVSGLIGDGSPFPNHAPSLQRTATIKFAVPDAPGTSFVVPLAYGARRVTILGDDTLPMAVRLGTRQGNVIIPLNTPIELPTTAISVQLTSTGVIPGTVTPFQVIYDLSF